jgi:1-pyrroline-4-hydroxy-2-carboxylate deaminase
MAINWQGVFPALTTKFTKEDNLDLSLFEKNLNVQLEAGVKGIILGGTLGEASVLTTPEKEALVKFTIEKVAGKVPVVINIAEGSTKEAIRQALLAQSWGCLLCVTKPIIERRLLISKLSPKQPNCRL